LGQEVLHVLSSASRNEDPAAMLPDAPGCETNRRRVPADERHGSQPGSGHCGHVVEIDHAVRFSFPAVPARNMRTGNENGHPCRTAELHEGE